MASWQFVTQLKKQLRDNPNIEEDPTLSYASENPVTLPEGSSELKTWFKITPDLSGRVTTLINTYNCRKQFAGIITRNQFMSQACCKIVAKKKTKLGHWMQGNSKNKKELNYGTFSAVKELRLCPRPLEFVLPFILVNMCSL